MSNEFNFELRLLAATIVRGSTVRAECVKCGEPTMTVTHKDDGVIAYQCKRATCGIAGYIGMTWAEASLLKAAPEPRRWQYEHALYRLDDKDLEYFAKRFDIAPVFADTSIRRNEFEEYVFLIRGRLGDVRGHIVRQPVWSGVPRAPRAGSPGQPKSREFLEPNKPCLAWYAPVVELAGKEPVVVVEDCLSAMAVAQQGYRAVALLGTFATWKEADEIRKEAGTRNVLIAFDNDATSVAYEFSQKWGLSFENCRVVRLEHDLKDSIPTQITSILGK